MRRPPTTTQSIDCIRHGPVHRQQHRQSERTRGGFLLVAVLFCLLIAGLTLVSLSQRSIALTTEAALRIDRLQQRWAVNSTQSVLLSNAGAIFAARDEALTESDEPMPWPGAIPLTLVLNGQPISVVLADEGAKANLNFAHSVRPTLPTKLLRQIIGRQFQTAIRLRPLPLKTLTPEEIEDGIIPRVFGSWSQVVDMSAIPAGSQSLPALGRTITFWGPGRLNVSRCDRDTALELCGELTSQSAARKILEAWWEDPRHELRHVIKSQGDLSAEDVFQLQQALSNRSSCYSSEITCQTTHSSLRRFAVSETDDEGLLRTIEFQF